MQNRNKRRYGEKQDKNGITFKTGRKGDKEQNQMKKGITCETGIKGDKEQNKMKRGQDITTRRAIHNTRKARDKTIQEAKART